MVWMQTSALPGEAEHCKPLPGQAVCGAEVAQATPVPRGWGACDVERRNLSTDPLTQKEFDTVWKEQRPVIVQTGLAYNAAFRRAVARDALLAEWGEMPVSMGTAESYTGRRGLTVPLREYIEEMMGEQTTQTLGNETFYLFGGNTGGDMELLLKSYREPPVNGYVDGGLFAQSTLSFGLGGTHSGVPFHGHGPGWSEVLHGRKRCVVGVRPWCFWQATENVCLAAGGSCTRERRIWPISRTSTPSSRSCSGRRRNIRHCRLDSDHWSAISGQGRHFTSRPGGQQLATTATPRTLVASIISAQDSEWEWHCLTTA
jgi:hypothetical protein